MSDFLYDLFSAYSTYGEGQPRLAALACPFQRKGLVGRPSRIVISSEVEKSSLQSDKRLRD